MDLYSEKLHLSGISEVQKLRAGLGDFVSLMCNLSALYLLLASHFWAPVQSPSLKPCKLFTSLTSFSKLLLDSTIYVWRTASFSLFRPLPKSSWLLTFDCIFLTIWEQKSSPFAWHDFQNPDKSKFSKEVTTTSP